PDKARILRNCQAEYETALTNVESKFKQAKLILDKISDELIKKKTKPFDELETLEYSFNEKLFRRSITLVNYIIRNHNRKLSTIENEKNEIKNKIIYFHTAKFISDNKYFVRKRLNRIYEHIIQNLTQKIQTNSLGIDSYNKKIKAEAIGADKINDYLFHFFNDDKLKLEVLDNGKYQLYRKEKIAKNLSTGEKNIIAFIYFFARLEETGFDLTQSIIFIDDPVSSLDCNHIFGIYGFLTEKLFNCGQLFITTHNFDFFNLLKDFKKYDLRNLGNLYLLKQTEQKYLITPLPIVLEKFKSEYNYLFSIIYDFKKSSVKNTFDLLFILPNIIRRFLEAFLIIKYPNGKKFNNKYNNFFKDNADVEKKGLLKIMDEYSHEENQEHARYFPDVQEIEKAIKVVLNTIEQKDPEHYKALEESLNN
ncbi:MAG: AAA family ATPase, partial [FCB group bacterium]